MDPIIFQWNGSTVEAKPGDTVASAWSWAWAFKIQIDSTGTNVIDRMYAVIIAKPTEMASGTNKAPAAPSIRNAGMNTARMHSMASKIGTIVSAVPRRAA